MAWRSHQYLGLLKDLSRNVPVAAMLHPSQDLLNILQILIAGHALNVQDMATLHGKCPFVAESLINDTEEPSLRKIIEEMISEVKSHSRNKSNTTRHLNRKIPMDFILTFQNCMREVIMFWIPSHLTRNRNVRKGGLVILHFYLAYSACFVHMVWKQKLKHYDKLTFEFIYFTCTRVYLNWKSIYSYLNFRYIVMCTS